jgi:hypothetical protein
MITVERFIAWRHSVVPRPLLQFHLDYPPPYSPAGDQLLLQANRVKDGLINGQVVTVQNVKEGRITLTDGRTLPPNYRQFSHGYCVTSHASQARTVDCVFLAIGFWSERLQKKALEITKEQTQKPVLEAAKVIPPPEVKITPKQSLGRGISM